MGCQDKKEQKDRQGYLYVFVIPFFFEVGVAKCHGYRNHGLKKIMLSGSVLYFDSNCKIQKSICLNEMISKLIP